MTADSAQGFVQIIKDEGLPLFERPSEHGDLFVEYNVVLPAEISPETKKRKYLHTLGPFRAHCFCA